MAICSKYKIAYFLLAPLQGFSGGKGYSLEGPGSGPGLLSKLSCGWERGFFFNYLSHQFGNRLKTSALLTVFYSSVFYGCSSLFWQPPLAGLMVPRG